MLTLVLTLVFTFLIGFPPSASGHVSIWHPSMYGFNVTDQFSYDNRPVSPLVNFTFQQWWYHGHLDFPPHPSDIFELPAGTNVTTEIACNKGATSFFASSDGGDIRDPNNPNNPCPGSPISEFHTTGIEDVKGCALAIAYKSNASDVNPEDFTVFSVNHTCVWTRFTDFAVPERMPACPEGGCQCAFFWIHSPDSGSEQNYMNGFKCNVTSATSTTPLATAQIPRRCGADPDQNKFDAVPGNCTFGAKQPFYWFQAEQNSMFEDPFHPPFYTDLYNFLDGAQNDIFQDSYVGDLPAPSPNQTTLPILRQNLPSVSNPDPNSGNDTSSVPNGTAPPLSSETGTSPDPAATLLRCGGQSSSSLNKRKRSIGSSYRERFLYSLKRNRKLDHKRRASVWYPFAW